MRLGNCTTESIEHVVREYAAQVHEFADAETESFMILP